MPKNINACLSHKTDDWKTPKIHTGYIHNEKITYKDS